MHRLPFSFTQVDYRIKDPIYPEISKAVLDVFRVPCEKMNSYAIVNTLIKEGNGLRINLYTFAASSELWWLAFFEPIAIIISQIFWTSSKARS